MKKISVWAVVCENFEDENTSYYFADFDSASKTFDMMAEKYKDMDEFEADGWTLEWFDPNYNEYSTTIYLIKTTINIYNGPIEL